MAESYARETPRETQKQRLQSQLAAMKTERSSFDPIWRDIAQFLEPTRTRFQTTDRNKGWRKNQSIIDSTATLSKGTMQSGMHSNITNPASKWYNLAPPRPDLAEVGAVKDWLHDVRETMLSVMLRANIYEKLHVAYGDVAAFGTAALGVFEDDADIIRAYDFPLGSFYLGLDDTRRVTVFAHETQLTIRQLVGKYAPLDWAGRHRDWSRVSDSTRAQFERGGGALEQWIDVVQVIQKNVDDYRPNRLESKYKQFYSCTYEPGGPEDRLLEETGHDVFPLLTPRWHVTGNDAYGTICPGMQALGDIKQLQKMAKQGDKAMDLSINPPMVASMAMRTASIGQIPGHINYVQQTADSQLRPLYEVRPDFSAHIERVNDVRALVRSAFKEDLFLMLAQLDRSQITATEIMERREEKMQTLGPVLERLNSDVLKPLIDIVFAALERRGLLPEAPEELQGEMLDVEYESAMAKAQKSSGTGTMERFGSTVALMAQTQPDIVDKVDWDQWVDEYGNAMSVPSRIVRSDEDVAAMREARAKVAKAQQMAEMAPKVASAAKTMSETDPSGGMLPDARQALGQWGGGDMEAAA